MLYSDFRGIIMMRAYLYRLRVQRDNLLLTFSGLKYESEENTFACTTHITANESVSEDIHCWHSLNVFYYRFLVGNWQIKSHHLNEKTQIKFRIKCWNQADFLHCFFPLQWRRQTLGFYFLSVRTRWTSFFCCRRKGLPGKAQWPGDELDNNNPRDEEEK